MVCAVLYRKAAPLTLRLTWTFRGIVNNLRFENFYIEGAAGGPSITQDNGNNGESFS